MFDEAAAPSANFVHQSDANYQHGYRIYANGLPQSEKTALYIVPSELNNSDQRYGVTYLPGIGVTQSIYGNVSPHGAVGNLSYFQLTLPSGGVQWTDDMPTEWYIKDSEGWQDLGLLNYMFIFPLSSYYNNSIAIPDGSDIGEEIVLNILHPLSVPVDGLAYLEPKEPYGEFPISINNDANQYLFSFCDGDAFIINEEAFNNIAGSVISFDITTIPDTYYADGYWPFLLFESMFTIEE